MATKQQPSMALKKRINISLGEHLHAAGKKSAEAREMDFSELLGHLLRDELERA
jgi:predicted DNA binding CopG/RHH family protein